jgi:RNA polymerase sigma-70 factor (ECF subfamily)
MRFRPFAKKTPPKGAAPAPADALTRFRSGDALAFDEIVDVHAPGIVRLFRRHGVDASMADDLAQEVFVRLFRTQANYESCGRLQVYLYKIARNVWLDWKRSMGARPAQRSIDAPLPDLGLAPLAILSHPAVGPAETLAGRDAARALTELLSRLGDGERLVLELALFEGMRYADIAEALLIPEGTVKSRVFHAIRKLRSWALHKEWT